MAETKSLDWSGGPVLPTLQQFTDHSTLSSVPPKDPGKDFPFIACLLIFESIDSSSYYYATLYFAIGPLPVASCLIPLQPIK